MVFLTEILFITFFQIYKNSAMIMNDSLFSWEKDSLQIDLI